MFVDVIHGACCQLHKTRTNSKHSNFCTDFCNNPPSIDTQQDPTTYTQIQTNTPTHKT